MIGFLRIDMESVPSGESWPEFGKIDGQCLSGPKHMFGSDERVRPNLLVSEVRESPSFATSSRVNVSVLRRERNCPNDAACGDYLVEKMLNSPDFVDSGLGFAACPICLLVSVIVGTPGDDGAVRRRVARLNFGEDTVDLFENTVQRSTVLQIDLPMIAAVKNCCVTSMNLLVV